MKFFLMELKRKKILRKLINPLKTFIIENRGGQIKL